MLVFAHFLIRLMGEWGLVTRLGPKALSSTSASFEPETSNFESYILSSPKRKLKESNKKNYNVKGL